MPRDDGMIRDRDGDLVPDPDLRPVSDPSTPWSRRTAEQLEIAERGAALCRAVLAAARITDRKDTHR